MLSNLSEADLLRAELKALRARLHEAVRANQSWQAQAATLQQLVAVFVHRAGGSTVIADVELVVVRDACGCRFQMAPTTVESATGPSGPAQLLELMMLSDAERAELRASLEAPATAPASKLSLVREVPS